MKFLGSVAAVGGSVAAILALATKKTKASSAGGGSTTESSKEEGKHGQDVPQANHQDGIEPNEPAGVMDQQAEDQQTEDQQAEDQQAEDHQAHKIGFQPAKVTLIKLS